MTPFQVIQAQKWRLAFLSPLAILKRILSLKTQNFDMK